MAEWWNQMPGRTRTGFAAGAALILLAAVLFAWWAMRTEYSVLFSRVSDGDAASIVNELKRQKVDYQLADGGATIRVPADKVHDVRLALMSGNTPIAGGVGFELFDRQGLGATEQSQRVSLQRALQGELARTVGALDGVNQARVHLVLPESTLFRRDRQEARAAVSLGLEPGVTLARDQIHGIQRLVAASVPGLDVGRVVVTDQRGITLSRDTSIGVGGASGEGQLTMKSEVEEYVTRKIVALLDRAYGPGRAIVRVDATLNFDEVKRTVQSLLPAVADGSTGSIKHRRQTNTGTAPLAAAGVFDEAVNGSRGTTETEYDYGRSVEQVVAAPGGLVRLTVGVVVPGSLDIATQERIMDLVRVAAGVDESRGDLIVVQSLTQLGADNEFDRVAVESTPPAVTAAEVSADEPTKTVVAAAPDAKPVHWVVWLIGGLVVLALVAMLLRRRGQGQLTQREREELLAEIRGSLERGTPA
jgi:flagellar M-ring protein FliF